MAVTATDVITTNEVGAILEERTEVTYQFRRAFRDDDATDISGNTKTFPTAVNNAREDMGPVAEEADYPRAAMDYDGVDAEYTKDGFEIAVSDEAADDSVFNVIADITEQMSIAAEARLDRRAYSVLETFNNDTVVGTAGNNLDYEALVRAEGQLFDDEFNTANALAFVSSDGWADLATDEVLNRSTDEGDELARGGNLGDVFGLQVLRTNTGRLGPNEALVVDTGMYGYESTRWDREVTDYREEGKDRDVFKIRHRKDFLATNPGAAVFVQGGVNP